MANNKLVRLALVDRGMKQWQLAELLKVSDGHLSELMREEWPETAQKRVAGIIAGWDGETYETNEDTREVVDMIRAGRRRAKRIKQPEDLTSGTQNALLYLYRTGWMQRHDRAIMECAEPAKWRQLRETISEMAENGGAGTQEDVCRYLLKYMDALENED